MRRSVSLAVIFTLSLLATTGCVMPTQTIIVRFEDLKSDLVALESSLQSGDWAKFDWEKMEIIISSSALRVPEKPVALGSFQLSDARAGSNQRTAVAEQPDLDLKSIQITDTVAQLMRRRQARLTTINSMKSNGVVGESNFGMLASPNASGLSNLEKEHRDIAEAENADRKMLLMEILRQKNYPSEKFNEVSRTFAEVQRQVASRGVWVQFPDSTWEQVK